MVAGEIGNTIWRIAELLRGDFKQSDYGKVILPFTLLQRLDCMLAPTKDQVQAEYQQYKDRPFMLDPILQQVTGYQFYNISKWTFRTLTSDPNNMRQNLLDYVAGFTETIRDVFDRYKFAEVIDTLSRNGLLYLVVQRFAAIDLDPRALGSLDMSICYEELIRRFAELSNETAGEHFTPREVIRLMVDLIFAHDDATLTKPGIVSAIYDPTAGTGGMLSVADETIKTRNPEARLVLFGQELNDESFAICKSELLIKGQDPRNIVPGNTLSNDGFPNKAFDYMLSNPPFGVEWKKIEPEVRREHEQQGERGRFGPGLPRISDGSLLFLLHLLSKMRPAEQGGSRIAIVFNGSPLFTGGAGSGESEIRRWLLEHDLLEAIIALPTDMFYNTGIATYIWLVTNRKEPQRRGYVQLINAVSHFRKLRKSLGSKRNELGPEDIAQIVRLYGTFEAGAESKIFPNTAFGYRTITVERPLRLNFQASPERIAQVQAQLSEQKKAVPVEAIVAALQTLDPTTSYQDRDPFLRDLKGALRSVGSPIPEALFKTIWQGLAERDETAAICRDKRGNPESDSELRDTENVPLDEVIDDYFDREVLPYVPDAWIDREKRDKRDGQVGIVGYEIPFTRHFYTYTPPRSLEAIDTDVQRLSREIMELLSEVIS